jgi:hypothetical protein
MMRLLAIVLALFVCDCKRVSTPDLSCQIDADCQLSGMVLDDCCGDLCGADHVYNAKWLASVREAHDRDCESNRCTKQADCPMPTTKSVARCKSNACVIEQIPR